MLAVYQATCSGHCHAESSAAVLDTESHRALETLQRAADNIIAQKNQIIEW